MAQTTNPDDNDVLTTEEAADLLKLNCKTVRAYAADGLIPGRKIGRQIWRFSRAGLLAWVKGQESTERPRRRS